MISGLQTYFFLASYGFRSKVLVFVIFKKIPDPGSKIAPDPGSGSATLGLSVPRAFKNVTGIV
jgi:hypothetical protein